VRSIAIKAEIVGETSGEGVRALLNSDILSATPSKPAGIRRLLHGEAVAAGWSWRPICRDSSASFRGGHRPHPFAAGARRSPDSGKRITPARMQQLMRVDKKRRRPYPFRSAERLGAHCSAPTYPRAIIKPFRGLPPK